MPMAASGCVDRFADIWRVAPCVCLAAPPPGCGGARPHYVSGGTSSFARRPA